MATLKIKVGKNREESDRALSLLTQYGKSFMARPYQDSWFYILKFSFMKEIASLIQQLENAGIGYSIDERLKAQAARPGPKVNSSKKTSRKASPHP
ncbi:MAG TPA: hypothetical protein VEC12_09105 [Bacteroidia bacterium]|nr:hypothetical protein [Bacteroidia bacterium]